MKHEEYESRTLIKKLDQFTKSMKRWWGKKTSPYWIKSECYLLAIALKHYSARVKGILSDRKD